MIGQDDYNQRDIREFIPGLLERLPSESTRMVDVNSKGDGGSSTGVGSDKRILYVSARRLAKKSQEAYGDLEQEMQEVGSDFFGYVNGKTIKGSWRYLSDVFLPRDFSEVDDIVQILSSYGESRRSGMFGISVESDHIHIIHDCSFSGGHCRDVFRTQLKPFGDFKPIRTYCKPIWEFQRTDWYDVFQYFFLSKRGTRKVWFRGESWKEPTDDQLVRWEEKSRTWGQMVRCEDSRGDSECERHGHKRTSRAIDGPLGDEVYGKKSAVRGKFSFIKSQTKALLLKYYCSPLSAIRDVKEFRENNLLSDPKNKDYLLAAFDDFGRDINELSIRQIYDMLKDGEPIFMTSMNYGTREDSLNVVDQLIRYQCHDDDEQIAHFLVSLIDILDKRVPKCNAICIHAPPSSGKNFFFDMVFALCLNYGQLGRANRFNVFAFQEAPNKRVLVWNEPNYESSLTDTIKMMMGGDPYTVKVKHCMDAHVKRTPVIILTNNDVPFMSDIAFKDRIIKFRWNAAPFLRDIEFKPYPLVFFDLLEKYNITFYVVLVVVVQLARLNWCKVQHR